MPKWHLIVGLLLPAALLGCARYQPPAEYFRKSNVDALKAAFGSAAESSSSAATPAAVAKPTGWATLKGTFKLNGTAPPREPVPVTKDHEVCAPGGKQALSEKLVVDSASGGIKDVLIYLATKYPAGDANWEHADYAAQREATLDFDQKNCVFLSHMFAVRSTQKIKVLNSDPVGHNTNISGGGKAGASNNNIPAGSYSMYAPGGEAPEPFAVACSIHPWMSANMISRDSPYFAVTKPDGTFEIKNVPAGVPLEFRVWQERSKFLQDVSVNGKAEKWSKGRLKLTLQPDEQKLLDVVVDAAAFSK